MADYEALRRAGRTARLTIGPWTHSSPGLFAETVRDGPEWFGEQLGEEGHASERAPVRLYVMGSRTWQEFSIWPPSGETQRWYLDRWGVLSTEVPSESAPDRYHYDPHDPTPAVGGAALNWGRPAARTSVGASTAATSSPTPDRCSREDLTVIGPLTATLYVRSSNEHTDFFVRLCDVNEKGRSFNLSDGIVRLRPGSLVPGSDGVSRLEISMWPTANTFRAGHRVRLQVSSGAHPLYCRNAGTGEPLATGANLQPADQEVWHDAAHPSAIALPVVRLLQDVTLDGRATGGADLLG